MMDQAEILRQLASKSSGLNEKSKIITITSGKGGVGKSNFVVNLAIALAKEGKKILLFDADIGMGNDDVLMGIYHKYNIMDVINGEVSIENGIIEGPHGIHLLPGGTGINNIEDLTEEQRERFISEIDRIDGYDYILIDCPPSLGVLTVNALTASDSVLIPVQCEYFALEGIMQLLNTITQARKNLNPKLEIEGVVLTMLDSRTNLGLEVVENVRGFFRERVYDTIIPRLIRLTEAPSHGKPIANYDPTSRGTEAYINLAKEVIARNE